MKFMGKIAIWFWGIYLFGTGIFVYQLLFSPKESTLLAGLVIYELVFCLLSSTAASLERIAVKGRRNEFMCSVVDKAGFLEELKKVNPDITFK